MRATLPEPVTKIKNKNSKRALHSKERIQSYSSRLYKRPNKQILATDGSIYSKPLPQQYLLNDEPASFSIAGTEISITHLLFQKMVVEEFSKIDRKSPFEQPTKKIPQRFSLMRDLQQQKAGATQDGSISTGHIRTYFARAMASKQPVSIASKIESIFKGQYESVRRLPERITAENHQKLIEIVKSSVTASALKAHEIQAMVLQSDDGNQFSSLLDDLKVGIESPSSDAVDAVLEIQCLPIPEALKNETLLNLLDFIKKHRATNSQQILVAVGAALRKVLLNLPASDIGLAAELMKSEGSLAVPIGVELEIAKMVVQRVIEDPSINASLFPELADALLSNAKLYSIPKMVNREFYNATALNSVLACLLLKHSESQSLCTQITQESPRWFSRLCSNRLNRIRGEIICRADSKSLGLVEYLNSLSFLAGNDTESRGGCDA